MLDLHRHEPVFWELRIVEFVRSTLEAQVGARLLVREDANSDVPAADAWPTEALEDRRCAALALKNAVAQSTEFLEAKEQIRSALHSVVLRLLTPLVDDAEPPSIATERPQHTTHFLERFWRELSESVCEREQLVGEEDNGEPDDVDGAPSYSFEAISFDDLNDTGGSVCR